MKKIEGDVKFDPNADYSDLEEVTGYLYLGGASDVSMPVLATVGGYLDLEGASDVSMPVLATVGGSLYLEGASDVSLPVLATVGGSLDLRGASDVSMPVLATVGGSLYLEGASDVSMPVLATVGGYLYLRGASDVSLPVNVQSGVGNRFAKRQVTEAFRRQGYLFADDILSRIVATKVSKGGVKIHKVVTVGQSKATYCIEADGTYSHGDTIKEARESLLYKIGERDKSAYEGWALDREITAREAIESYRVITGACEAGVRNFVQTHGKLKSKYTVREVIEATQGQYGNKEYEQFFGGAADGGAS